MMIIRSFANPAGMQPASSALAAMLDLLKVEILEHEDAWSFFVEIVDDHKSRDEVARLLAADIVQRLCEGSVEAYENWATRASGGPEHDTASREELEAYLMSDFKDADDEEWTRLGGAVVEHLWAAIAPTLDGGWGLPLHVEHEHFSVIDHGGDGLSIYSFGAPDLRFRLWESKRHASATKSVTSVVTGAAAQLSAGAPAYLARMSKPLQLHEDQRIQQMAGRIVKLWTTSDDSAGIGVSIGTSTGRPMPARPFKGLKDNFTFSDPARREGVIISVSDLQGFAQLVRSRILEGIE